MINPQCEGIENIFRYRKPQRFSVCNKYKINSNNNKRHKESVKRKRYKKKDNIGRRKSGNLSMN